MVGLIDFLVNDPEVERYFTVDAELSSMLKVEAALAEAQAMAGFIPTEAGGYIAAIARQFKPDVLQIRQATQRDGVAIPELVRQLREAVGKDYAGDVHKGATSQDIIDSALMIRLKEVFGLLNKKLSRVLARLDGLQREFGQKPYMAHTRMQIALPMLVADKLDSWIEALLKHQARLLYTQSTLLCVQSGGALGNNAAFGQSKTAIVNSWAQRLGLCASKPWQTDRSAIIEIAQIFSLISGTLGKVGQDIALMAQNEVHAISLANSGTSSAMPHKNNPVKAEILVSIARLQAGLLGTIAQSQVHENERSGAAWTLEWCVLPQMAVATGGALEQTHALLENVTF